MKKNKLSCESYYWIVCNSKTGKEEYKYKTLWSVKFSLFNLIFYFLICFIPNSDSMVVWIGGILNFFVLILCLINLVFSKTKSENIALRNFVLVFINFILLILNLNFSGFLWFYEECWNTDFQYIGIIIWLTGLVCIIYQCIKIKIKLLNGYYDKNSENPPESDFKKILILSVASLVPMMLVFGSRKGPFVRDIIGEEYFAIYSVYIATLLSVIISKFLSMMYYNIKWNCKYSNEERENLLSDYKGDKK